MFTTERPDVVESRIVSPSTLLVVGITVVASFLIPNYDMGLAIRVLRFPMLISTNLMGMFGIAIGWFIILVELCSMDSFGVPYLQFKKGDMKDIFIRAPLWEMNNRPEAIEILRLPKDVAEISGQDGCQCF